LGGIVIAPIVSGVSTAGVDYLTVEIIEREVATKKGCLLVEIVGVSVVGVGRIVLMGSGGVELPET